MKIILITAETIIGIIVCIIIITVGLIKYKNVPISKISKKSEIHTKQKKWGHSAPINRP